MSAEMEEYLKIALTGISAAILTNLFGYWRERRTIHSKYLEETLKDLYVPLIKEVGFDFTHLTKEQIGNINKLLSEVPHLVDRNLVKLYIQFRREYSTKDALHTIPIDYEPKAEFDKKTNSYKVASAVTTHYFVDLKLKFEILKGYNIVRKNLGLPYDLRYASMILRNLLYWFQLIKNMFRKN